MRFDEAEVFCRELAVIPDYPGWSKPACEAIATAVCDWCETAAELQALVTEAVRALRKWEGIPGMRSIWEMQHQSRDVYEPSWVSDDEPLQRGSTLMPRPPKVCPACNGTGVVLELPAGLPAAPRLCTACAAGSRQDTQRYLEQMQRVGREIRLRAEHARNHPACGRKRQVTDHRALRDRLAQPEGLAPSSRPTEEQLRRPSGEEIISTMNRAVQQRKPTAREVDELFGVSPEPEQTSKAGAP